MAVLELTMNGMIMKKVKRALKEANLTMRIWNGKVIVSGWPEYKDPKSVKQLSCRERFREAQLLMMADFCRVGSMRYWQKRAKREKYKTAKGCARAYYYNELKKRDSYAASDKGRVYRVTLVPLKEVLKSAKVRAYELSYHAFNREKFEKRLRDLGPQLDAISGFMWDYEYLAITPPE